MAAGKSKAGVAMFLLACMLALVGLFMVNKHIAQREKALKSKLAKNVEAVETVKVLFTSKEFKALDPFIPEGVVLRDVPKSFAPADAISTIEGVKELYAKMDLVPDEIIRASKTITKDEVENLAFSIPQGRRAITLSINDVKGVGFAVMSGDRVDVVGMFAEPGGDGNTMRSQLLLQDIQVLEVVSPGSEGKQRKSGNPSVTLAVTPSEAEVLALLELSAQLVLILRPVSDDSIYQSEGTTISSILGQGAQPVVAASETDGAQTIEIFTGGTRVTTKVPR